MSKALNKAILARLRGDEHLSGRAAEAQEDLAALLATNGSADKPAVAYGAKASSTVYPSITFREDAGLRMLDGTGVGIVTGTVYRFELWEESRDGTTLPTMGDCLELLFDTDRDAPALDLEGDSVCYNVSLLTSFQGPFHDDLKNLFYATMAFVFAEARP